MGITRRDFVQRSASAAALAGLGPGAAAVTGLLPESATAAEARARGVEAKFIRAHPVPLERVRLTGGPLKRAQEADGKYLLSLDPDRMIPLGIMTSELVMNAVKHAHPTGIPVQISIGCRREANGRFTIEVGDDGVGLPEGSDAGMKGGIGFRLIRSLAQSLDAQLRIESDPLGLAFLITLPPPVHAVVTN